MEKVMQVPCGVYYDAKYLDDWDGVTQYVREHIADEDAKTFLKVLRFINKHDKHYAVYACSKEECK